MPETPPAIADPKDEAAPSTVIGDNAPVMSVGDLSRRVKGTIEDSFGYVRVRGEISRPSFPASGHCYLRLKDDSAVLDAVIWRGVVSRLGMRPEEGTEVIATGRLTTYPGRSSYQIVIDRLEIAGEGALLKLLEERRRKLDAEGLFAAGRKRPLPFLPNVIGVVTSPTGAVIRDILHRLDERFPRHVLIWPVSVQGDGAADQVAAAIAGFNALSKGGDPPRPDVLIVARGGGSLEDLWAFNEEIVVRAAAGSDIPLISAVGHETDTTLIDHAADLRAPTPTAAAEIAVPVRADLAARVAEDGGRLGAAARRAVLHRQRELIGMARGLPEPRRLLESAWQHLDDRGETLRRDMVSEVQRRRHGLAMVGARLNDPRQKLSDQRGALRLVGQRLASAVKSRVAGTRAGLAATGGRLTIAPTAREIVRHRHGLADLGQRFAQAGRTMLRRRGDLLGNGAALLDSLSYRGVLRRGFAVVRGIDGAALTRAADAAPDDRLWLEFHDGPDLSVPVVVTGAPGRPRAAAAIRPATRHTRSATRQGRTGVRQSDLFDTGDAERPRSGD